MQHNDLQDALAYLRTLFSTYESQGVQITGSRMPFTQYANFAAMKYLLFLANQDRVITDTETEFINVCLGQSVTTAAMERFLQQFSISFSGAADALLAVLAALVRVDLQGNGTNGSVSLLWMNTVAQMGKQFSLDTAGKIEPQQQIVQNSMMQQLSRYRSAAICSAHRAELDVPAEVPRNFGQDMPSVPQQKESVVSGARSYRGADRNAGGAFGTAAPIGGTAECEGRIGESDSPAKNPLYPAGTRASPAPDFTAYGLFRKPWNRKNHSCPAVGKDLCPSRCAEKRTFGRGRPCNFGQRLCGTDGN